MTAMSKSQWCLKRIAAVVGLCVGLLRGQGFAAAPDASTATAQRAMLRIAIYRSPSGPLLPCHVYLTQNGKAIYPEGLPRWERDGGFCCDGAVEMPVPPGRVSYRIERGPEWEAYAGEREIKSGSPETVIVHLQQWIDMNDRGWFSGDLHVHRPIEEMPMLLRAADLNVAPDLTFWNRRATEVKPPHLVAVPDKPARPARPRFYHTLNQEDERIGGALLFFNLREPIQIEGAYDSWPSGFAYHQAALKQGIHVEQEKPFWWEAPVNVALGKVASMGIVHNHFQRRTVMDNEAWGRPREADLYPGLRGFCLYTLDLYYRYLNLGWDIPASAGSASGVLANPVGHNRVYVHPDGADYEDWFEAFRAGRSFATNGPMLFATVNGEMPGAHFEAAKGKTFEGTVRFEALSRQPIESAEIIVNGKVAEAFQPTGSDRKRIEGSHRLTLDQSAWIAVRAFETFEPTVRFAHTSPFYVAVGGEKRRDPEAARFFVRWMDDLIPRAEKGRQSKAGAARQFAFRSDAHAQEVIETYRRAREVYAKMAE